MSKISLFPEGKFSTKLEKMVPAVIPFTSIEFDEYLDKIKDGEFQDEVLQYRAGKLEKLKLRGVTASGVFSYRSSNNLTLHSGFLALDLDVKDQPAGVDLSKVRVLLEKDPYVYSVHHSAGGFGLVVYFKVDADRHLDSFYGAELYMNNTYEVIIDQSCKDVSRFRFVSFDPNLYINRKARIFKKYIPKKKKQPRKSFIFSESDLDHVFQQISDTGIDLTDDYHDWYKIGCGISHKYGESGRDYFKLVSQNSIKYDDKKCDDLYDAILKRNPSKEVTIATFLWLASNQGIEIKTQLTEHIERIAKTRYKSIGTNGGAKDKDEAKKQTLKYLSEIDGIEPEKAEGIIDQVANLPKEELNEKSSDLIADIEAFLNSYDLKFNEITRECEINGHAVTDRDLNTIYIDCKKRVDDKVSKDLLFSIIDSDHTKSYHPFKDFFNKYKNRRPSGNFDKLCECIDYTQYAYSEGEKRPIRGYLELFLKKWLLGIIASMHGTYSVSVLVLTGGQRVGKTKFFRNILPDELMDFYAESKLDDGKDSEILMTRKLIILDDEFGGKSKQDAKRLKELSSKQWFNVRRPYGRTSEDIKRIAVLCGTSNDDEVINDPTGNRRIIPVNINNIDHDKMSEIDMTDLFIELYHEWKDMGDDWMLSKDDVAVLNLSTSFNEQPSIEEEMISKYFTPAESLGGNVIALTNTDIKTYIEEKNVTIRISPYKLGVTLKKLGYEKTKMRIGQTVKQVYLMNQNV